jgi:hypothetical protein
MPEMQLPAEPQVFTDRIETNSGRVWSKSSDGGVTITQRSQTVCKIAPAALARRREILVARLQRAQKELDWFDKRTQDVTALQVKAVEKQP